MQSCTKLSMLFYFLHALTGSKPGGDRLKLTSVDRRAILVYSYLKKHPSVTHLHHAVDDDLCENTDHGYLCGLCFIDIEK